VIAAPAKPAPPCFITPSQSEALKEVAVTRKTATLRTLPKDPHQFISAFRAIEVSYALVWSPPVFPAGRSMSSFAYAKGQIRQSSAQLGGVGKRLTIWRAELFQDGANLGKSTWCNCALTQGGHDKYALVDLIGAGQVKSHVWPGVPPGHGSGFEGNSAKHVAPESQMAARKKVLALICGPADARPAGVSKGFRGRPKLGLPGPRRDATSRRCRGYVTSPRRDHCGDLHTGRDRDRANGIPRRWFLTRSAQQTAGRKRFCQN